MGIEEFKQKIQESRTELEVRRVVHWYFPHLIGTQTELMGAIALADARAEHFAIMEEGALGGAFVPEEMVGV